MMGDNMIKIAVNGACGKMGTLIIQNILKTYNMKLVSAIDINNVGGDIGYIIREGKLDVTIEHPDDIIDILEISNPDVLIDFTRPDAATKNIISSANCGIDMVIGTTGFTSEQMELIKKSIKDNDISAVISPNFSIGIDVFWRLIGETAKRLENYDIEIIEIHHNQKKDSPSGTALKTAEIISKNTGLEKLVYGRKGLSIRDREIGIHAVRGGDIIGDHIVLFAGNGERIEIKHQIHSRQSFVNGVLKATEWVSTAKPGIYSMQDILNED